MAENSSNFSVNYGSEKSFGIVFSIVFFLISIYPLFNSKDLHIWALVASVIFLLFAFLRPTMLILPNKFGFKFGMLLGSIISPILMAIIYFVIVFPTGLIMRLLGKDLLNQKLDKDAKSYWILRSEIMGSMKNQF